MRGPTIPRLLVAGVFLGGIAFGAYYARAVLPQGDILPGVRVDGAEIPQGVSARAFVEERARALMSRRGRILPISCGRTDCSRARISVANMACVVLAHC